MRTAPTPRAAPSPSASAAVPAASPPPPKSSPAARPAGRKVPKTGGGETLPVANPFVRVEKQAPKWPAAAILVGAVVVLIVGVKVYRGMTSENPGVIMPFSDGGSTGGTAFYGGATNSSPSTEIPVTGTAVKFDNDEAQKFLDQADAFSREHPEEADQARVEYARIASVYEGTKQGKLARDRLKAIDDGRRAALEAELVEVDRELQAAAASGAFGAVYERMRRLRARYGGEAAPREIAQREQRCLDEARKRFDMGMTEVDRRASDRDYPGAVAGLDGLDGIGIPDLVLKADRRRAELVQGWREEEAKAVANYAASFVHVQEFCDAGEYEKAEAMQVELAGLPDFRVIGSTTAADLDAIRRTRALLDARFAALQRLAREGTPHEFERLGREGKFVAVGGTVTSVRKDQFMLKVGSGTVGIKLDTLSPAENVRLAKIELGDTAASDLGAAAYAVLRKDYDGAETAYLAAEAKGSPVASALDRLDLRRISTRETAWEPGWTYRLGGWESRSGKWEETDSGFVGGEEAGTYVSRQELPGAYRLRIVARKQSGLNGFLLGFTAFGKRLVWAIGDGGNRQSVVRGIESSQIACTVAAGTWHTVEIAVLEDRAIGWLDGKRMWKLVPDLVVPASEGPADLSVGVVSTRVAFREVSLNRLK